MQRTQLTVPLLSQYSCQRPSKGSFPIQVATSVSKYLQVESLGRGADGEPGAQERAGALASLCSPGDPAHIWETWVSSTSTLHVQYDPTEDRPCSLSSIAGHAQSLAQH